MKQWIATSMIIGALAVPAAGFAITADEAFAKLKALEGTWTGQAGMGGENSVTTVTYKLTGGGTAVVETLFGGSEHEMVTVYHMNGPRLMLTHYCAAGNQPRMQAQSFEGDTIKFDFLDGTNMSWDKDQHMHSAWITFIDADHLKSGWMMYQGGKAAMEALFDLTRQKG